MKKATVKFPPLTPQELADIRKWHRGRPRYCPGGCLSPDCHCYCDKKERRLCANIDALEDEVARLRKHIGAKTAVLKAVLRRLRKWEAAGLLWKTRAHHWKGEAVRARQGRPAKSHGGGMDFRETASLPERHRKSRSRRGKDGSP